MASVGAAHVSLQIEYARTSEEMTSRTILAAMDKNGDTVSLESASAVLTFSNPVVRELDSNPIRWRSSEHGFVVLADPLIYRLRLMRLDGSVATTIAPNYKSVLRSSNEIEETEAAFRAGGGMRGVRFEPLTQRPDIHWFDVDYHGNTWVLSSRGHQNREEGSLGQFDVWSVDGELQHRISLHLHGDLSRDRLLMEGPYLMVLHNYEDAFRSWRMGQSGTSPQDEIDGGNYPEPMYVSCYAVDELLPADSGP